jgi:hypothetical protein
MSANFGSKKIRIADINEDQISALLRYLTA